MSFCYYYSVQDSSFNSCKNLIQNLLLPGKLIGLHTSYMCKVSTNKRRSSIVRASAMVYLTSAVVPVNIMCSHCMGDTMVCTCILDSLRYLTACASNLRELTLRLQLNSRCTPFFSYLHDGDDTLAIHSDAKAGLHHVMRFLHHFTNTM